MKRILIVDENQVVGYTGGAEKIICEMANVLSQRGYKPAILCMNKEKGLPWHSLAEAVDFFNLAHEQGKNPFTSLSWQWQRIKRELLRALGGKELKIGRHKFPDPKRKYIEDVFINRLKHKIAEWKPDVILTIDADSAYIVLSALGKQEIPVISMYHGNPLDIQGDRERIKSIWKRCAAVQVLQERFIPMMKSWEIPKLVAIPNPVAQVPVEYLAERRAGLESQQKHRIVTVGRIEGSGKRQHLLLEAFSRLAAEFPDWELYLYGAADNRRFAKKCQRFVREKNLSERIIFAGTVKDIFEAYKQADIFAFPSRIEGFGLALCEAMSAGVPVVVYRECYPDDAIVKDGETGWRCADGGDALEASLKRLMLDSRLRMQMGKAGHCHMENFAPESVWDKWQSLIEEVAHV